MAHGALPFFVARRYLFSRKRISAINLVSAISVVGVAFGTAALLCTLSVFNGFHDLIGSLYTAFDPEVKIVAAKGKSFAADDPALEAVRRLPEVEAASASYTDNALILFRGNPQVITLKGVDDHFERVTGIRSILYPENGTYQLESAGLSYGIPGIGLASMMGSVDYGSIQICAPTRGERINLANPAASFNAEDLYSSGVCFAVSQKQYDEAYMIAPLAFAQRLFEHEGTLTSLELKLKPSADPEQALRRIRQTLGSGFKALNRAEQQEDTFNVMNIEKTMAYFFLTFILLVACFNIVGTVSMLMIDKRADVVTLRSLGADEGLIFRIFLCEGSMISFLGAVAGTLLGLLICYLQQTFGLLSLGGSSGNFIIDAYPVSIHPSDVVIVFFTVLIVGFLAVLYPVKYLTRRFL
ncbi:MAG: FtsX-like permease family protein [Alloprevotella sp.]|uniref:FtsX-like permease family protein n=1 Tax=Prevotellamassilia timonensis TaxID=1852370 RepID=UPI001F275CA5|nr:FtsX-like permease family protein [Prevotellamassilia timonensis]MCI5507669.1 FtsX-like permease family protein [Bacteroidales bacterium]MDY2975485.1 FtsX-like permease family protein [Alloprevotella sp.]MCF2635349.1 ABC transporter permease [Prevotellamassilia timonensis]MCI7167389.1 FtsX-like permease family protein [Bacteroidales bacterium]MDD6075308.1 FtsX-like permease family protein [Bacteroidales bacterium]